MACSHFRINNHVSHISVFGKKSLNEDHLNVQKNKKIENIFFFFFFLQVR